MANNVFGNPITDETLKGMPQYVGKTITRTDRATVAMQMKNAENKDHNARNHVEELKRKYGNGISALCTIYNATGDPVSLITTHNYHGHIWQNPYPVLIQNGQWAAFLHVKPSIIPAGSSAAVVYRGRNKNNVQCDWMLAWSIPYIGSNHAYTEIRAAGHYSESNNRWGTISTKMGNSGLTTKDTWNYCVSHASIGNNTSPMYEGIMTLEGASLFLSDEFASQTPSLGSPV